MRVDVWGAAALAAVSVLLVGAGRAAARRRLMTLGLPQAGPALVPSRRAAPPGERAGGSQPWRWFACAAAGVGVAAVLGGPAGVLSGALAALAAAGLLDRFESPGAARRRERILADLPVAADLLAAGAAAGAPLDDVALAVADALGGPLGGELNRVVALVRLGADPAHSWAGLAGAGGTGVPALASFGRAVARALAYGAPLAPALNGIASRQRADARMRAEVAARRVGVLAVAPLTLCFLPAFVLVGVVPVVVSVAGSMLDF